MQIQVPFLLPKNISAANVGEMSMLDFPGGNVSLLFLKNNLVWCIEKKKSMPIAYKDIRCNAKGPERTKIPIDKRFVK